MFEGSQVYVCLDCAASIIAPKRAGKASKVTLDRKRNIIPTINLN